ncbi:MAG: radical SAM protein [Phormidesmis sp.]
MPLVHGTETIQSPLQKSSLDKKGLCDYVINVASGCLHGCTFCYVPSTPVIRARQPFLKGKGVDDPQADWGRYLLVRENLAERLEAQLSRKRTWKETSSGKGVVLLCSGTDPYQNQQAASITHSAIQSLIKYKKRIRVLTRSPLFLQDLSLLNHSDVTIGMSLPHLDDKLSRQIEPYAPPPSHRLEALHKAKKAGCRIFIAIAPTHPSMGVDAFTQHIDILMELQPEVMFWEPINARGSNGKRMISAGIEFTSSVMQGKDWAANFIRQWDAIETAAEKLGCRDRLHIWPDPALKSHVEEQRLQEWWYRPTIERWQDGSPPDEQ